MFTLKETVGIVIFAFVFWVVRSATNPYLMSAIEEGDPALMMGQPVGGFIGALILTIVGYLILRKLWRAVDSRRNTAA